jgi:type II secretion system protein H
MTSTSRGSPRRTQAGYTLVEVLVVVTIMGIVAAIVVPQMLQAGTLGVQAAARALIADIIYAQNEAVVRQTPHKVIFDEEGNRYRLVRADADAGDVTLKAAWKTGTGADNSDFVVDFNRDDRFQGVELLAVNFGDEQTVAFDDLGSPDRGGSVDLRFNQHRYRVTVAAFTGRVSVAAVN